MVLLFSACGPTWTVTPAVNTNTHPTPTAVVIPSLVNNATPPTAYVPTVEAADCAFEVPDGYHPKCGYLIVPEDRANPTGRKIRLHVAVFKSTDANPAPDPVIQLAGGPGGSALVAAFPILLNGGGDILKRRDLILFDQRGTQYSKPFLYCLPYDEYLWDAHELDLSLDEYNNGALPQLATCLDDWRQQGINIAAYTNAEIAADVNDLRLALGYEQVNLYGTSYGTRLALEVMRDYPAGIRSVILDSAIPPQANLDVDLAANVNRSLQEVFRACVADALCAGDYGDIEAKFYEIIDRLEAAPVQIAINGPYRDQPYMVYLDGDLFIDMIFVSLYSMVDIPNIPHLIQAAYEESYDELSNPAGRAIGWPVSTVLFWSITCSDEVPFEIGVPENPELGNVPNVLREHFTERYTLNVCSLWNVPASGAVENEAVVSSIPTLLFSGRYDPVTPPRWTELAAETLSVHYLYEFSDMSHGVMRANPCALQIGLAFLDDPLNKPDATCFPDPVK
jgi:pimeloyl-ACP methyl ester carboxylesterase